MWEELREALRGPWGAYERAVAWALPPGADPEEQRRGRIALALSLAGAGAMGAAGVLNYAKVSPVIGVATITLSALTLGIFPVMRRSGSVLLGTQLFIGMFFGLMVVVGWLKGGLLSTPLHWAPAMVILAALTSPRRVALAWTAALSVMPFGFALAQDMDAWPAALKSPWVYAVMRAGVCWLAMLLSDLFERERLRAHRGLQAREQALREHNRDMRLLLDNADQGFVTLDAEGRIGEQRSAVVEVWFGRVVAGITFGQLVERADRSCAAWFDLGWAELQDGHLPRALCLEQLPRELQHEGRTLRLSYKPLWPEGAALAPGQSAVMVVLSDVTSEQRQRQAESAQRELAALFERLTQDRAGTREFFEETSALIDALRHGGQDRATQWRQIHTIKGGCAIYGVASVARLCHQLEADAAERLEVCAPAQLAPLFDAWARVSAWLERWLAQGRGRRVELDPAQHAAFVEMLARGAPYEALEEAARGWALEPTRLRLERQAAHALRLARALGKDPVEIALEDNGLRLDPAPWGDFWGAFIHALRNCVDHGLEPAHERRAQGKPPARLTLATELDGPWLQVRLEDNGRGVDWAAVAQKARALGLPAQAPEELLEALFADGLSTTAQVTEVSGRGLGMGALRARVRATGGELFFESARGEGTIWRFRWPAARFRVASPQARAPQEAPCSPP